MFQSVPSLSPSTLKESGEILSLTNETVKNENYQMHKITQVFGNFFYELYRLSLSH